MELIVSIEEANQRLDIYLSRRLDISRSYLQELIKDKKVTLNGVVVKAHHLIKEGDHAVVNLPPPDESIIKPEDIKLTIFYEDNEVIVIDKPAGMVVHPTERIRSGTLVNALLSHTSLAQMGQPLRPGIVHRLDKDTSGVLVVAKTNSAYWRLVEQFKAHSIKREYLAMVHGLVVQDKGQIEARIGRPRQGGVIMRVGGRLSRPAITHFRVEQRFFTNFTLLRLRLETGRTHQIRVHLSFAGYPIVGDRVYGKKMVTELGPSLSRQALHAQVLGFVHPQSGEYIEFTSPLPQDMSDFIQLLSLARGLSPAPEVVIGG